MDMYFTPPPPVFVTYHKKTSLKKVFFIIFALYSFVVFSQNRKKYYIEIKEGVDLGIIQRTINPDETIIITTNDIDFSSLINSKPTYEFKKAFPTSITPRLQRVYILTLDGNAQVGDFLTRNDIEKFFLIDEESILLSENSAPVFYPNDYEDIITGGNNTSLDLISAPLAWTITTGDPNVLVGVADSKFEFDNPELIGQILDNINIQSSSTFHGTGVAGLIAANTNNGIGVSSLAYNTKLVTASCGGSAIYLINGLLELSKYSGIRVINCSWAMSESHQNKPDLDDVINEINSSVTPDVLIVAGAGNENVVQYMYPASYDSTISTTSVGSRFPIGYYHDLTNPNGITYWWRSWMDCHGGRPDFGEGGHTRNDKVDVTAPGILITLITDDYANYPSGYRLGIGTSGTAPFVTALAALIFSVNPQLTSSEVKEIIRNTADDIYYIPYNQQYQGLLGTGRINAYRAVLTAKCMLNSYTSIDLAMQNSELDSFDEPDTETQQLWQSKDIWVRNQNDGLLIKVHQNPEYDANNPNYVYVRVTNNSCVTSSGNDQLKLYWAKASTSLNWPDFWDGSISINGVSMGDEVGAITIPPLEIGETKILEFEWNVPNPEDYIDINPNPWHFCLLSRIESPDDPMTYPEVNFLPDNVRNNNNIAWKNMTVVDIIPNTPTIGGVVAISNPYNVTKTFQLKLFPEPGETGKALYEEAEISVEMDDVLFQAWSRGNQTKNNLKATTNEKKFIVSDSLASLNNIQFYPNEFGTAFITFNFLTKEVTAKRNYTYHLAQIDEGNNLTIGGETYEIRKQPRPTFSASAGGDEEIEKNESITLQAENINEEAVYNWYDVDGNLIYTGTTITVSPQFTQQYKLEVISNLDGFKDYDDLQVTVNPYKIESLVPNPATSLVTVNYIADEANSAYLMVVHQNSGNTSNYIINTEVNAHTIDLTGFSSGLYSIILVCDGEVQGSKNLSKQ